MAHVRPIWSWSFLLAALIPLACDPAPGDTDTDDPTATDGATSMASGSTSAGSDEGQTVEFDVAPGRKGEEAQNVRVV